MFRCHFCSGQSSSDLTLDTVVRRHKLMVTGIRNTKD